MAARVEAGRTLPAHQYPAREVLRPASVVCSLLPFPPYFFQLQGLGARQACGERLVKAACLCAPRSGRSEAQSLDLPHAPCTLPAEKMRNHFRSASFANTTTLLAISGSLTSYGHLFISSLATVSVSAPSFSRLFAQSIMSGLDLPLNSICSFFHVGIRMRFSRPLTEALRSSLFYPPWIFLRLAASRSRAWARRNRSLSANWISSLIRPWLNVSPRLGRHHVAASSRFALEQPPNRSRTRGRTDTGRDALSGSALSLRRRRKEWCLLAICLLICAPAPTVSHIFSIAGSKQERRGRRVKAARLLGAALAVGA